MKEFSCRCGERIRLSDAYAARVIVCPACGAEIEVPQGQAFGEEQESPSAGPGPLPPSQFTGASQPPPPPPGWGPPPLPGYGPPPQRGQPPSPQDFEISIGRCIGDVWRTVMANWKQFLLPGLIFVASVVVPWYITLLPILWLFINPFIIAGLSMFCLLHLRMQHVRFSYIFHGYRRFWSVFGLFMLLYFIHMLLQAPMLVDYAVRYGVEFPTSSPLYTHYWSPHAYLSEATDNAAKLHAFSSLIPSLVTMLLSIYFAVALSLSYFFLMDRQCGPLQAIKGSWRLTKGYRMSILAIMIVFTLVTTLGLVVLGVGLSLTVSILFSTEASIYYGLGIGLFLIVPIFFLTEASIYHRLSLAEAAGVHRGLSSHGDSHHLRAAPDKSGPAP